MEDLQKYERMSKQELLNEILMLRAMLEGERASHKALQLEYLEAVQKLTDIGHFGPVRTEEEQEAIEYGRGEWQFGTVVERRPYRNGYLTNEYRRNKKTGTLTGPYWQYRGVEDGSQINVYLGKTDDPEARAEEKLAIILGGDNTT